MQQQAFILYNYRNNYSKTVNQNNLTIKVLFAITLNIFYNITNQLQHTTIKAIMFFKVPREDAKYEAAFVARKHLALPVSISTLMNLFEATIQEKKHAFKIFNSTNCEILNINPHLHQAYANKTKLEKINYYAQCVEYLASAMKIGDYSGSKKPYLHPIVEANACLKSKIIGKWEKYTVKISLPNKKMVLTGNKTQIVVTLDKYYVRTAKDTSRLSLVLEAIVDNTHPSEIRIAFEEHFHNELKKILEDLSWEAEKDRFNQILTESSGEIRSFVEQRTKLAPGGLLTEKVRDRFEDFKKRFLPTVDEPRPNKRFIVNQGSRRLYIAKDVYYYEEFFFLSKDELVKAWKMPTDLWNPNAKEFSVIETDEDSNIEVVYEKLRLKDKLYDNIFLREDISTETEGRILSQGLKNNYRVNQNTQPLDFDYSFARVIAISESECRLCVEFDIQFHHKSEHEVMTALVSEFSKIYEFHLTHQKQPKAPEITFEASELEISLNPHSINIDKSFSEIKPIIGSKFDESIIDIPQFESQVSVPENIGSALHKSSSLRSEKTIPENDLDRSYIQHVFPLHPDQTEGRERQLDKVHYLWQDWEKIEAGGVLCINDKIVSEQKKIFKHIIASFGKNLFKIKSVLNISLPVGIFKKESHLNTIAKNFSYAPVLLEPRAEQTVLERMKLATVFLITTGTVGISMEKPFNPVLGETYQGWIDGCPIYLEQVSHHPPRSAYLLCGRGYRICGQIEPKIELGMNSVKGYNERENTIEFDDGARISFSIPKLVIKGMIFGDREFNFEDRNYVYDIVNHVFCEVTFGPRRGGGFFTKAEDPTDFVFGRIMKVSPNFYVGWKDKRKTYPQKADIVEELSHFEGVWNESLSFDGKKYFDFRSELPCRLDHEEYSLPSNSTHRKDLQKLIEGKVEEAQAEKERMEEFQRKDRRLRESHHKK